MSGLYSGVQARITTSNPLAEYVPCAGHFLNLVGTCAAESVTEAVDFFSTLQEIYNFFTVSTHRWEILTQHTSLRLKSLSQTRHDACYTLEKEWPGIIVALNFIGENKDEKPATRAEAKGLQQKLQHLKTAILVIVWNAILDRFNSASKKLQDSQADLSSVIQIYRSLALFLQDMRNKQFSDYKKKAKALSGVQNYYRYDTRRKKTRKLHPDESRENERTAVSGEENFQTNIYYPILDTLSVQLKERENELVIKYPNDLEETFANECIYLHCQLKDSLLNTKDIRSAQEIYIFLNSQKLQDVYPNVDIALRIFLSIPATNCSEERSFSTLKRVKAASMAQERLNALALLSIEAQLVQKINYNDIVDNFAQTKARKKIFTN
ncbi:uncharacterized protein LOC130898084 [Diorhabda carinulata]|uniref:uncharacterized protein LOC130898084 n=1 Tax=Diorhabda carinulata TaxID=1163345 RepID=UPI0025A28856|nr:uncharacterized protein LOC130898084 [Diorhabda carinulata]